MGHKDRIHSLIKDISGEVLQYVIEQESNFSDRWVPAAQIRRDLELDFVAVPIANKQYGPKGWLFAIITRMLEDQKMIEYKKYGNRTYYRKIRKPE